MVSNTMFKRFFPNITPRQLNFFEAGLWLACVAPIFCSTYTLCNWLASIRSDVVHLYFNWEKSLPVIPALIIPYLSIGLFVAVSFFLCQSREALRAHALRLLLATLISCACYLIFPVGFGLERPTVEGVFGYFFRLLNVVDQPFNETPSSHISLLLLIWPIYARRFTGVLKFAVDGWFTLIGLSVFFTYQHHLIGALAGAAVAGICFWLIRDCAKLFGRPHVSGYFAEHA
jgi:hypothetical protein